MEAAYSVQDVLNRASSGYQGIPPLQRMDDLTTVLTRSQLRTLPSWIVGVTRAEERAAARAAARGPLPGHVTLRLATAALARRDFARAADLLAGLARRSGSPPEVSGMSIISLALAGRTGEAREALDAGLAAGRLPGGEAFAAWARRTLPLGAAPVP